MEQEVAAEPPGMLMAIGSVQQRPALDPLTTSPKNFFRRVAAYTMKRKGEPCTLYCKARILGYKRCVPAAGPFAFFSDAIAAEPFAV